MQRDSDIMPVPRSTAWSTGQFLLYDLVAFSALILGGVGLASSSVVPLLLGKSLKLWCGIVFLWSIGLLLALVRVSYPSRAQAIATRGNEAAIIAFISILLWESVGFIAPSFLPIEVLLRTPDWVKHRLPESVLERSDFRTGRTSEVIDDPVLARRYAPHLNVMHRLGSAVYPVITDSYGFPNVDETLYTGADVVVTGDSFTMGSGVSFKEAWPQQLSNLSGLRVLNLGQGAWDLYQYPLALEQYATQAYPQAVIVTLTNWNDLQPRYYEYEEYRLRHPDIAGYREFVARTSSTMVGRQISGWQSNYFAWGFKTASELLGRIIPFTSATTSYVLDRLFPAPICTFKLNGIQLQFVFTPYLWDKAKSPTEAKYLSRVERDLSKIRTMAEQKGLTAYLVYLPAPEEIYMPLLDKATELNACAGQLHSRFQSGQYQMDRFRAEYARAAKSSGLSVWDATSFLQRRALEGERLAWMDDFHPNVLGHRRIAEFVAGILGNQ